MSTVAHIPAADLHPRVSTSWLMMSALFAGEAVRPSFSCSQHF